MFVESPNYFVLVFCILTFHEQNKDIKRNIPYKQCGNHKRKIHFKIKVIEAHSGASTEVMFMKDEIFMGCPLTFICNHICFPSELL